MSQTDKELLKQLKTLNANIELLTKVTALGIGKDSLFKQGATKEERLEILDRMDLPDEVIASAIGSTPGSVATMRTNMKKAKKKEEKPKQNDERPAIPATNQQT